MQESTSEAVNAWYAVQLLGSAMGNTELSRFGQLLTAMEIVGAQVSVQYYMLHPT